MDHVPVMLDEVLTALSIKDDEVYVDCTFGAGGYSRAILNNNNSKLIAIDQDPSVKKYVDVLDKEYPGRVTFHSRNFSEIEGILHGQKVDGIVLDLGVSSMQLDQAERGFSFMRDSALDMRMSASGPTAADFVNSADEFEIARVIFEYGDERASRKIASRIITEREKEPITTTARLAEIVRKAIGYRPGKIDPATKTFQAIRIWVNDEMGALERFLEQSEYMLKDGGRLVVVTFHSLEDRIVKRYFQEKTEKPVARSKYAKDVPAYGAPYKLLMRKAVHTSDAEIKRNPRSRSAKLRAAIKVGESYGR
jgi:16S rRNA (cytosine1402-N4)-methyltransferase